MIQLNGNGRTEGKARFTLQRLLDEVLYKEEVQDLLEKYGESQSGQKSELIERLLESMRLRGNPVDTAVREVLDVLPVIELKHLGRRLGVKLPPSKDGMVRQLMKSVDFECCVRLTERECPICKDTTAHEMHFGPDWRANYFRCTTCNEATSVETVSRSSQLRPDAGSQSETLAHKGRGIDPEMAHTLNTVESIASSVRRAERQKAAISLYTFPSPPISPSAMLDATRLKEEREFRERAARHRRRAELFALDTMTLSAGLGIPPVGDAFDKAHSSVYLVIGVLFLIACACITFFLAVTWSDSKKEKN